MNNTATPTYRYRTRTAAIRDDDGTWRNRHYVDAIPTDAVEMRHAPTTYLGQRVVGVVTETTSGITAAVFHNSDPADAHTLGTFDTVDDAANALAIIHAQTTIQE